MNVTICKKTILALVLLALYLPGCNECSETEYSHAVILDAAVRNNFTFIKFVSSLNGNILFKGHRKIAWLSVFHGVCGGIA